MTNLEVLLRYMNQTCGDGWKLSKDGKVIEQRMRGGGKMLLYVKKWLESEDAYDLRSPHVKVNRFLSCDDVKSLYSLVKTTKEMIDGFCLEEERRRR